MISPVLAILGRCNVGKSTLFNALTKTNKALVTGVPNTTRDFQYGVGKLGKYPYLVIDTAGITTNHKTNKQTWIALEESDIILFVVDARVGVTNEDLFLAKKILKFDKSIYLIVNKSDGVDLNMALADFYSLGLGVPIAISACKKRGVTQLINKVFMKHSNDTSYPLLQKSIIATNNHKNAIKVAIVGQPNVGKSTLLNIFLGKERVMVSNQAGTTRDSIIIPFKKDNQNYVFIDTAGILRKNRIKENIEAFSIVKTLENIKTCNVVLFLIDAHKGITDQDLRLLRFIVTLGKAIVIIINKWDSLDVFKKDKLKNILNYKLNFVYFAKIHFISALYGSGIENIFASIKRSYRSSIKILQTSMLTNVLQEIIQLHNLPIINGKRIKLRYAHSGGHNPKRIIIHGNQTEKIPMSYIRYMQKYFIDKLNLTGIPLILEFITSKNPYINKNNKS